MTEKCKDFRSGQLCVVCAARCGPSACEFDYLPTRYRFIRTQVTVINPRTEMTYADYFRAKAEEKLDGEEVGN